MSRPRPVNRPPPRRTRATGIKKRRVEPDSPKSSRGSSTTGVRRAAMHRLVASMS